MFDPVIEYAPTTVSGKKNRSAIQLRLLVTNNRDEEINSGKPPSSSISLR
ncbi:hypothetical protein LINPERPRIM_LOCUS38136 [Linum perenne]